MQHLCEQEERTAAQKTKSSSVQSVEFAIVHSVTPLDEEYSERNRNKEQSKLIGIVYSLKLFA